MDALRGDPEAVRVSSPRETVPALADRAEVAVRRLREVGARGTLTYSDEDCRLHAVSLPELEPVRAPSFEMCRPATAAGGLGAVDGDVVWAGLGYGAVQVVLSREELSRAIEATLERPGAFRAVHAVPLDDERYVVLAESPEERVALLIEGDATLRVHPRSSAALVRSSPAGGYYALLDPGRFVLPYTRDGDAVQPPQGLPQAHAIAWSPDDRWTAIATERSVFVYPSDRPGAFTIRVPLAVQDLDWSAGP